MLNRKLDILSNEINDYFVINNTTKIPKKILMMKFLIRI